jgi:PelA/Pel-15E family pectate lyase
MNLLRLLAALTLCTTLSAVEAVKWSNSLPTDPKWLAGDVAKGIAENLLVYQYPSGGWPKNVDMAKPLTPAARAELEERAHDEATIDNGATTTQVAFLARVYAVTQEPRYRSAAERGIDYLLAAQYPNGGWPQYFPPRKGYYTHITFNDGAMANVLEVLRGVAEGRVPYAWADADRRRRAAAAVARGIDCILKCQVVQDGKPTIWAAQHDEVTFAPAWARKFEPPSLASAESVGIVRFLMSIESPSPDIVAAIDGAAQWFERNKILGFRAEMVSAPTQPGGRDRVVIADPQAGPIWARFYELGTNRPLFMGRDSVVHYKLEEIEHERRVGYAWYNNSAASLLAKDYPRWRERLGR